ncbi:MAG: AAA family ATPase, partial [Chloroflexales bacterium]|nr:AAA family ATPase [Chloroflexales bacterium]
MKHYNQFPNQTLPFSTECSAALQRYLPPDLVAALFREDYPTRSLVEAFVQLASTRYAISTYLPRHLVARRLATTTDGPWLEWVEGSLLFADVSGSTALAEQLTALGREGIEIVTNTLNDFFDTMLTIIKSYGGDLLNFGGDALLVLFRGPDHPHVASHAAAALLAKLSGFERTVPGIGTFTLSMRIGVESGCVALASAGHPEALRYSALGNVVNRVARAETYCEKGELALGPGAWSVIADSAEGEELADGYVRVRDLQPHSFNPGLLPRDEPVTAPPEQAIPMLVQQLNRISPYLPTGLLSRILVDPQRPRIEADLRPVTVLFAQIIGLGALVEALEPEQAASILDAFLRPMQEAIQRFGGVINKLDLADEGDKILAIFGAPVAYEDHAERAARAALAMLDLYEQLNEQHPTWNIKIRLGLNTGIVFAGNVGTAERKEYTVMGDAVNVAARVMGQAAWGEIWCSAATAAPITSRLLCADRGRFAVKGKSEPLHLLRIEGVQEPRSTVQAQESPMVGRQAELDWLRERLAAARAGQGKVARIAGDAGVGKSCLIATLLAEARVENVRVIHVACLSYAMTTPYSPWSDWLKELCGIVAEDDQAERVAKLGAMLDRLPGDAHDWLPLLAPLVRVEVEETQLTRALDPQQRRERRFELIAHLLRAFANSPQVMPNNRNGLAQPLALGAQQQTPLLVVFEDLHWADQTSLDLWQYVTEQIADLPVFLLGVHRPQFGWGADAPDGADVLTLNELSPADSEALLLARLGSRAVSTELLQQIVARANGNPLFLEELLRAVIGANGSATTSLDQLPDSLNDLLLARIDQLDEYSRSLLRIASVIGQRFPVGVLQFIHLTDLSTLLHRLGRLDAEALTMLER